MDPGNNIDPSGGVVSGIEDVVVLQEVIVVGFRASSSSISMSLTLACQSTSMLAMGSLYLNKPATETPLREAETRKVERGSFAGYRHFQTEYYHKGSTTYNTKEGWYTQEAYVKMLGGERGLGFTPASDMVQFALRPNAEFDCSVPSVDRLYRFFAEIGEPETSF